MGLTKSAFMHYCLVENSKKSKFEVFNYKIPYKVKSPNFACILISCYLAYEKYLIFIFCSD
jgi:hypothetical protein